MEAEEKDPRLILREEIEDGGDWIHAQTGGDVDDSGVSVEDEESAGWNMRRLSSLYARLADLKAQHQREVDFLRARHEAMVEKIQREVRWRRIGLEMLLRARHRESGVKKIETHYGSLRLRKARATREIPEDGTLEMWLRENGHADLLKVEVNRGELAKRTKIEGATVVFKDTGEIVEPITVKEPGEPTFSISLPGEAEGSDEE